MSQRTVLVFGLVALASIAAPCLDAAPPRTIADLATVEELEAELEARCEELAALAETPEDFTENKKKIAQVGSMLAVAAQALVDHESDSPRKSLAPDLRDAAIAAALAEDSSVAKDAVVTARMALDGQLPQSAPKDYVWSKLVKQRAIMEDTENRMQQLQRALRRPKDPVKESRIAISVALASLPTVVDTHAVKDPAKLPEWDKLSRQMLDQMIAVTKAIKDKDAAEADAQFKAARATCVECHRHFKVEN